MNSMQETIRAFRAWLEASAKNYKAELQNAGGLFWGDREDLETIESDEDTEMFFNEWLMLDFSVNGYDNIPAGERKNFLDIFLESSHSELSMGAKTFAQNAKTSFPSFYRILKEKRGSYTDLEDLFLQMKIRSVDKNLSFCAEKGEIIYGRFCQNEKGEHIGAGSQNIIIPEKLFSNLSFLINSAYKMALDAGMFMSIEQFLKWNSYIYYREIVSKEHNA